MKVRIEQKSGDTEDEVVIICGKIDERIRRIHQYILEQASGAPELTFYKDGREYYFPLDDVLFFETDGEHVYAHTARDAYRIRYRLYELEELLPSAFVRAAKSAIVNTARVYSVTRNLAASSLVTFADSHKQVYVSRHYYNDVRRRLSDRNARGPGD